MLELELKTFEQKLSELLQTDNGRYVLKKDDKMVGIYSDIQDALQTGYEKFGRQPFFVEQILPVRKRLNFANNNHLA